GTAGYIGRQGRASELPAGARTGSRLSSFQRARAFPAGRGSASVNFQFDLQGREWGELRGSEEKAPADVQGPGSSLRLLGGAQRAAVGSAPAVARLRQRRTHGTSARSGL